jgi:hypothetical protein
MRFVAAAIAVPVLFFAWQAWRTHALEQQLRPVASGVAGRPVEVDCQSFLGSLIDAQAREGEVRFDAAGNPEPKLFLARSTCTALRRFAGRAHHSELDCLGHVDWRASSPLRFGSPCYEAVADTVYAVLVLAHEAYHTAGVQDEAQSNCFAIQAMAWTAEQLGAPVTESELLALAMDSLEPLQEAPYGTGECHAGGRLDLHPDTPAFPTEDPTLPPHGGRIAGL